MLGITNSTVAPQKGKDNPNESTIIYVSNATTQELLVGDTVLVELGAKSTATEYDKVYSANGFAAPIVFFDDQSFMTSICYDCEKFTYLNGTWSLQNANDIYGDLAGYSGIYQYHSPNIISWLNLNLTQGSIVNTDAFTLIPNSACYLGEYNGQHYCSVKSANDIRPYDPATNTSGTAILDAAGTFRNGFLIGNEGFLVSTSGAVSRFIIDAEGNISWNGSNTISSAFYPLHVTGTSIGHYIFATSSIDKTYRTPETATTTNCTMLVYRIMEDKTVKKVDLPLFRLFETTPCMFNYDYRNQILCVGTRENVYFYQFNPTDLSFTQIQWALDLPIKENTYCYQAYVSPAQSHIVVIARTSSTSFALRIYHTSGELERIVDNNPYHYIANSCVTGVYTGQIDSHGKYGVQIIAPKAVEVTLQTMNGDADEVTFSGGLQA